MTSRDFRLIVKSSKEIKVTSFALGTFKVRLIKLLVLASSSTKAYGFTKKSSPSFCKPSTRSSRLLLTVQMRTGAFTLFLPNSAIIYRPPTPEVLQPISCSFQSKKRDVYGT